MAPMTATAGDVGVSRLQAATGIPLRVRLYERGSDGTRCRRDVSVRFSVLTLTGLGDKDWDPIQTHIHNQTYTHSVHDDDDDDVRD